MRQPTQPKTKALMRDTFQLVVERGKMIPPKVWKALETGQRHSQPSTSRHSHHRRFGKRFWKRNKRQAALARQYHMVKLTCAHRYVKEFYDGVVGKVARMTVRWAIMSDRITTEIDRFMSHAQSRDECDPDHCLFCYCHNQDPPGANHGNAFPGCFRERLGLRPNVAESSYGTSSTLAL